MTPKQAPVSNNAQIKSLRTYLERKPQDGRAWLLLAQLLSHRPPGDELRQAVEQAIELIPDNYQVWLLAARMQQHEHGAAAVLKWLETVERDNPDIVAIKLASATMRSGRDPGAALLSYQEIIKTFPKDTRAYILLADMLQNQSQYDDAAQCVEQALHIKPESAEYWTALAKIRLAQGQGEIAVSAASHAIDLDRKLLAARAIRAEAYRQSLQWQEALADFQELKKHRPHDPQLLNKTGVCLIRLEQYESAAEHFEKALELDPDYTIARINIGLLCATKLKSDEAITRISEALNDPDLDDATRKTANITLAILLEQKRLKPFLEQAEQTGNMEKLQAALDETPAELFIPDQQSVDKLWQLAALCRDYQFDQNDFKYSAGTKNLPFIEACAQCKFTSDVEMIKALNINLSGGSVGSEEGEQNRGILNIWHATRDRQNVSSDVLLEAEGEAWLRYWQARLLKESPEKLPGQYKAIANTIGREMPTPPECVTGTYRLLLNDIRPTVPAGLARAVFMYAAISKIHGYCDGNGRLGRFLLGWETESTGIPASVIPMELLPELSLGLQKALFKEELESLVSVLIKAHASTDKMMAQLSMVL